MMEQGQCQHCRDLEAKMLRFANAVIVALDWQQRHFVTHEELGHQPRPTPPRLPLPELAAPKEPIDLAARRRGK